MLTDLQDFKLLRIVIRDLKMIKEDTIFSFEKWQLLGVLSDNLSS